MRLIATCVLFATLSTTALAQPAPQTRLFSTFNVQLSALTAQATPSPQSNDLPSPDQHLNYPLGSRFTSHERILGYFDQLARHTPRLTVTRFGESYEGRPLTYAVITSEKNQARIEEIRREVASLSLVGTTPQQAQQIVERNPVVVWLAFGVHGNESSSAEAAMRVAHELLTGTDSAELLEKTVVIIDPLQNPDGRERYINNFRQRRGRMANPNPLALEHREPWPVGRYNHYLIDMNRDWAWESQLETRARVAAYRRWNPQLFVDLHEMSAESSYFFPPDAHPINRNVPPDTEKWLEVFGRAISDQFNARQWPFFIGERFDLFYPAYGDSWPSLRGAIGMTFEVAGGGRAGTEYRRRDGDTLTLTQRIDQHFTSAVTTVRTAAARRTDLLNHTWRSLQAQTTKGRTSFVIPAGETNLGRLVDLMLSQGIEVRRLTSNTNLRGTLTTNGRSESRSFPAGSVVISTAQPLGGFVMSLFEKTPAFDESFLAEQREKVSSDQETDFYDITAWALPIAMNLRTYSVDGTPASEIVREVVNAPLTLAPARIGYIVSPLQGDFYQFVSRMLRAGVRMSVSEIELAAGAPRGSVIVLRGRNIANLDAALQTAAEGLSIRLTPVDSLWSEGPALGSTMVAAVRDPQIALVGGDGIDENSFGMLWHTLDIDTETPHTVIPFATLGSVDLANFRVVIIPDTGASLLDRIGKSGVDTLRSWVRNGGTIVAIKRGAAALRAKDVEISKLKEWEEPKKEGADDDAPPAGSVRKFDFSVPGAAFNTTMNTRSFLTFGLTSAPVVLVEGAGALTPLARKGDNIISIAATDPLASGFAFPQSIDRLTGAPYVTREELGQGSIVTFADEPYYRLFWRATLPLFMNSVLYSPTFNERQ